MRKIFAFVAAIAALVTLSGCGGVDRTVAHWTGYSKICVEGVQYIQFTSGATVQLDQNGQVITC